MLKYGLSLALLCGATTALAQNAQAPATPPAAAPATPQQSALQAAAMGFAQCIMAGVQGVPASATPQAGATTVLAGCAAQRRTLDQSVEGFIGTLPQDQQAAAREQYRTQIGGAEGQIAARITQMRAAPPAAAPAQ